RASGLDDYTPSTVTRVLASNGQVVGEFATQRRVIVGYDDINPVLRQAIIATEDAEFDRHFGVNIWRIAVAALTDIVERRRAQGASTLTQQLARNLKEQFGLTNEKSFERKIRETILAIQIEKRYTKKEIFTIYCNQPPGIAPFFVEEVRKHLERQYGAKVLYENGLSVTTTLDSRLQEIANRSLEHGLRAYDKRHGWRRPTRNVVDERHTIEAFKDD